MPIMWLILVVAEQVRSPFMESSIMDIIKVMIANSPDLEYLAPYRYLLSVGRQ